jgi:hypothetical protein
MPVEMPDSFKRLTISSAISAAKFHESVCDFGIVYGLALQGLGLAKIESNLLPRSVARSMAWASKTKYFTAAAAMLLLVSIMCFARTALDRINYADNNQVRQSIGNVINTADQASSKLKAEESKGAQSEATIDKELKYFDYRDVVPLLYQTIISVLPNEKNNPEQRELYEAFARGDVKGVKSIERQERKQIFITGMSVYFVSDIASAQFGAADFTERGGRKASGAKVATEGVEGVGGGESEYMKKLSKKGKREPSAEEKEAESGPGFVVTVTGYSPYKDIGGLMDPVGVEGDPNKWGVVTRLMHLDDIVGWKNPFELYEKAKVEDFKLETGVVDLESAMPVGIGLEDIEFEKVKQAEHGDSDERFLIDPMTREIISKVAELDDKGRKKTDRSGKVVYKSNDHWFRLDIKFTWKDAPKEVKEGEETNAVVNVRKPDKTKKTEGTGKRRGGEDVSL